MTGLHHTGGRPRLSERALPRLYFAEGRCSVLLFDVETGDAVAIDPRAWVLLASADGTRDLDGVLLAATREGVSPSLEDLVALLAEVRDAGMLAEGPAPRRATAPLPAAEDAQARETRPVERLPGYTFRCDGRGSCCRIYATIVFSPLEAARARVTLPHVLDGGDRHEHAFMPERGPGPCAGSAVALVAGGCAYLDDRVCALHRAGGPGAKPLGCNVFPLSLVDDGVRVRASALVECACVLASAGAGGGAPLVPDSVYTRADLDPDLVVEALPPAVLLHPGVTATRADYVAFCDAALAALPSSRDAAATAWSLAATLVAHGLDPARARAAVEDPAPVDHALAARYLAGLASKAAHRARSQAAWLADGDLRRRAVSALAAAAALLADGDLRAAVAAGAGAAPGDEALYLHASLFGHQVALSPLVAALRDRAVAIWVARVFPLAVETLFPGDDDPAFTHPLALVEALLRGHGLRRYLDDVFENPER